MCFWNPLASARGSEVALDGINAQNPSRDREGAVFPSFSATC